MALHRSWRGAKEWDQQQLHLSTGSEEACKLYDAIFTQYIGWYDEASLGGIEASCEKLLKADPNFVMGHVLCNGLDLMGTGRSPVLDKEFRQTLDDVASLAAKTELTAREKQHVKALQLCGDGYMSEACQVWEDILVSHPLDMLALKFAHDSYFYLAYQPQMRDSIARVLPYWKPDMPHYGYLMGMHSFGLVETNMFAEAERVSRKGLEINKSDCWSTHSLAHVLEMTGRQNEGIAFMSSTVNDWEPCAMLACHNFWHWAVYHIEKGEYQAALDLFDTQIGKRCKSSGAMLDVVDACSLLFRLEMEGQVVTPRWNDIFEVCRPHTDDHLLAFNDAHMLLSCLGSKNNDTARKMMDSIEEFIRSGVGSQKAIFQDVGASVCQAFMAYEAGEYGRAVKLLLPKRYQVLKIGGSNAQRDMFNLFLINAALKSPQKRHHQLARSLLNERKAVKENAPMTDRLMARAMALHAD